ncbi:MAG: isopentenyl phosphate kinase [Candidatus Helarchaeales archaeon]
MKQLIILKIGGSLITKKNASKPEIDTKNLDRIVNEIKNGWDPSKFNLLLIHGAGSFGHPIVKETGIAEGIQDPEAVLAFAKTQKLQNELNVMVCEKLLDKNIPAIPFQPSTVAIMKNKELSEVYSSVLEAFLELSLVPVLYGVPAYDKIQQCSILSGDQLIVYFANHLSPSRIISATNVDGVLDENDQVIRRITSLAQKDLIKVLKGSDVTDVTGGMAGKVLEFFKLKKQFKAQILNGNIPSNIEKALKGDVSIGTIIEP